MGIAEKDSLYDVSYFHEMHKDSRGIIALMKLNLETEKKNRCIMRYSRYSTMCKKHLVNMGEEDLYFTQNTFKALSKSRENLLELKSLYIDLDYYKTEYTREQVIGNINILVEDKVIPRPTFLIDSGRGLYAIWKINAVPAHVLPLWQVLIKNFYYKLKYLGADSSCLEPSRVLRVDGSINSKNKKVVHVIDYHHIVYNINDLQSYLTTVPKENTPLVKNPVPRKKKVTRTKYTFKKNKNVLYLNESSSLYHKRLLDIQTLCEIRGFEMEGYRERILFLTRYWMICLTKDKELAENKARELNQLFKEPLPEKEFTDTKPPDRACTLKAYRYSSAKLMEILKIEPHEEIYLQTIITDKERKRRWNEDKKKKRRNQKGLTEGKKKIQDTEKKIRKYYKKGYLQKEIAEMLGLSVRTIRRYYKSLELE